MFVASRTEWGHPATGPEERQLAESRTREGSLSNDHRESVADLVVLVLNFDDVEFQRLDQLDEVVRSPDRPVMVVVLLVSRPALFRCGAALQQLVRRYLIIRAEPCPAGLFNRRRIDSLRVVRQPNPACGAVEQFLHRRDLMRLVE